MFSSKFRQIIASSIKPQTYIHQSFQRFQPFHFSKYTPTVARALAIPGLHGLPSELSIAEDLELPQYLQADKQQRNIITQLIQKYGQDSNEVKEFALTTADLSPVDELRMLTPCGQHYTNSIYYQVLALRFQISGTDKGARESAKAYEQCLIERVDEELHFWSKAREVTQISAGFVEGIKDQIDRQNAIDQVDQRANLVSELQDETTKLKELVVKD